nr:MAG TPA: hypothetical protein [Caudoviricetes sp.]
MRLSIWRFGYMLPCLCHNVMFFILINKNR